MAFDEGLAQMFRDDLAGRESISEKKMFGGLCFMNNGHMLCGVHKVGEGENKEDGAMFRVGPDNYETALSVDGVRELAFTGRPMKGMVECDAELLEDDNRREKMLDFALDFTGGLKPK